MKKGRGQINGRWEGQTRLGRFVYIAKEGRKGSGEGLFFFGAAAPLLSTFAHCMYCSCIVSHFTNYIFYRFICKI